MNVVGMVKGLASEITSHWNKPAAGKQIPYKEMAAYSVGGVGVQFIIAMIGYLALSATSMILTVAIGISLRDLQTMVVISSILGFITTPIRGMIFDNTRSKAGKFRPYILTMGIPSAIFATLMVFLPYDSMSYGVKFISVLVIYNLMNLFAPFYTTAYNSLPMVMSSNSDERTSVFAYSSVIYSLAPTITGAVVPLMGDMSKLQTYKLVIPLFSVIGLGISMLAYFGTKEKIIVSKQYTPKVKFIDGLKSLSVNKYFWLIYGSNWLGFLGLTFGSLFNWVFIMGMNGDNSKAGILSLLTLLSGTASLPGMLFAPQIIKKFGKKNVAIFAAVIQVAGLLGMAVMNSSYALIFIFMYVRNLAGSIQMVFLPAMKADTLDYQQYKTGSRLEGMMEQIGGLIGSFILMGTGYIMPEILRRFGLDNNYNDLREVAFRGKIITVVAVCTAISVVMSALPFLFYNLSEKKHGNIIKVLRVRAMFEDFGNNELDDAELIETMDGIRSAEKILGNKDLNTNDKKEMQIFEAAKITLEELNKFKQKEMIEKVSDARIIVSKGTLMPEPSPVNLKTAIDMPEETKEEIKLRKKAIKVAEEEINKFNKAEKAFVEARKLVRQADNYVRYDEICQRYDAIKAGQVSETVGQ